MLILIDFTNANFENLSCLKRYKDNKAPNKYAKRKHKKIFSKFKTLK